MATIKGIAKNSDSIEFLNTKSGKIKGDLHVTGDVTVTGRIITNKDLVDFASGTDEQIANMLEMHYSGAIDIEDFWSVGDTRTIHLNGVASPNSEEFTEPWPAQDITIVIVALNHYDLKEPIGVRNKAAVTVQTREVLNNVTSSFGAEEGCILYNLKPEDDDTIPRKWSTLGMRTWMNGTFLTTCFSSKMQELIKEVKFNRLSVEDYMSKNVEEVTDKVFLPSYPEIFGNVADASTCYMQGATPNGEEGTQWEYFKTSASNIDKCGNNNGQSNGASIVWWTGSPAYDAEGSQYGWMYMFPFEGAVYPSIGFGYGNNFLAPAFCL